MAVGLRRTARANQDLVDIWLTVAADNERAADRLLDGIYAKLDLLRQFPEAGPARNDIAAGLRYLVHGNYLILYRIVSDGVEVVRVVHGRRRLRDLV